MEESNSAPFASPAKHKLRLQSASLSQLPFRFHYVRFLTESSILNPPIHYHIPLFLLLSASEIPDASLYLSVLVSLDGMGSNLLIIGLALATFAFYVLVHKLIEDRRHAFTAARLDCQPPPHLRHRVPFALDLVYELFSADRKKWFQSV